MWNKQAITTKKKNRVAILTWDKIDFRAENIAKYKENHFIIIKGSIHHDQLILKVYTPNNDFKIYDAKLW